ncbi:hypothetical protein ACHHYP_20336 [Achlya hypogyna]|uniref:Uncharacterized protein n=1 Tax=Achlya hypogyna TaxID=1202772 RepID=A0A1V9YQK0_ACHHY|nr:hypothetical protein ACHHYP_20336 [Achlya hypogyna]
MEDFAVPHGTHQVRNVLPAVPLAGRKVVWLAPTGRAATSRPVWPFPNLPIPPRNPTNMVLQSIVSSVVSPVLVTSAVLVTIALRNTHPRHVSKAKAATTKVVWHGCR